MGLVGKGLTCVLVLSMASSTHAGFFNFGMANNDGTNLTVSPTPGPQTLDLDPGIPGHSAPRGFGSTYFGAGLTHEGDPSMLWTNAPTDVGIVITGIMHDGHSVASGFSVAAGELGAFDDVFVNQTPPTGQAGLNTPKLFLTHEMIHEAQIGDPMAPDYANHAHVYFQAEQQGIWDVTFVLRDLSAQPLYGDSTPFTVQFMAVPEPASLGLLALAACGMFGLRRRNA